MRRLGLYMEWQNAGPDAPLSESDVRQPDLWRLSDAPAMAHVLEKRLDGMVKFNTEAKNMTERLLPEVNKLLTSTAATLLSVKGSLLAHANKHDRKALELRSLPAPVVEQQRDVRRLHTKVESLVRELESSITVLKASLAKYGNPAAQPAIQNVLRSVDKIQQICKYKGESIDRLARALDELSLGNDSVNEGDTTREIKEGHNARESAFDEVSFAAKQAIRSQKRAIGAALRQRPANSIMTVAQARPSSSTPIVGIAMR